ncbi:MAG: ATPase [Candidatus Thorarchaeota archaeon]|nr:ATPase [Candidatus Thorarchaeota archaeon]
MEPVFIDLHIHTSDNPANLNDSYDLDLLKSKIEEVAEGSAYLISLTDHNTINKSIYLKAAGTFEHILLGVELHVRNYDSKKPYHCHIYFNLKQIDVTSIDGINAILDELYPNKVVSDDDSNIPILEVIMKSFDSYEFVILPHGGQSHSTFDKSIPNGVQFDTSLERNIYYNHFDGFTARSNTGLERTLEYFDRLGIKEFVNLITASDNYSPQNYPKAKAKDAPPFVKTWMMASPTFNGLRLSLSESSRLKYGEKPDSWAECIKHVSLKNDKIDIDVVLTPGLNVVIGGSSSGKTLFVDSVYRQIIGDFDESNYINTPYSIQDIQVTNPAGQAPHYFYQNYIIKICDQKDKENTIDDIPILKSVFPADKEERQEIDNGLTELSSRLASLVQSVNEIELLHNVLSRIFKLSHLIVTDDIQGNPLKCILPDDKIVESIEYGKAKYKLNIKHLDEIDAFLSRNPLVHHDNTLIEKLKKELKLAFDRSEMESAIREIIISHKEEIDDAQEVVSKEITTKRKQFEKLLECIKQYFKFDKKFYESLDAISKFSIKISTKEIESMGHTLFIDNEFELTKEKFLEVVNGMLKPEHKITRFDDIMPEALFEAKFRKRSPKVVDYDDFKKRVNAKFRDMNKKKYRITTKEGKDFDNLSAGWKTSVILDLILGRDSDNAPLIIDQPEDNLATGYINSGLLKAIKKCKSKKQIILVSHNATIPMLGDAQNVVMCRNDDKVITIKSNPLEGSIDGEDVVDLIAETTDGGKISIKKRVKKYNLKKFRSSNEASIQKG